MSSSGAAEHPHEIIIVRHGGHDDHDDHHGGVWKIAFADFMTAMMCFFLVMWLINAANEQTKAAVASYFNPVKLIDRNASRKGLEDLGDGPNAAGLTADDPKQAEGQTSADGPADPGQAESKSPSDATEKKERSDEHLFADPYAVLAEIASDTGQQQNISAKGDGGVQVAGPATGASGGESYRDPFAPDFWSQQVDVSGTAAAVAERREATGPETGKGKQKAADIDAGAAPAAEAKLEPLQEELPAEQKQPEPTSATRTAAAEIGKEVAEALGLDPIKDSISVVATSHGVMISVTDQLGFGMFEIGSALPRRELVLAMEKIGKVLAGQQGKISIRGHTDGRPFRSEAYDNWRLSSSRAQSAYYMLVRGGLDEQRVTEVSGLADRELKIASDPLAAANRRIEILLDVPQ
jgi:chemotaxis protein MotB